MPLIFDAFHECFLNLMNGYIAIFCTGFLFSGCFFFPESSARRFRQNFVFCWISQEKIRSVQDSSRRRIMYGKKKFLVLSEIFWSSSLCFPMVLLYAISAGIRSGNSICMPP